MKNLLILLPVILLFACSKQIPKGKSKAKVSILALNGGSFPGGAFIHGKKSTGESFNKRIQGADFDIELDNGEWKFTALVWDNGAPFEGVPKCDFKPNVQLTGGEINVDFDVDESECKFGPPESHAGNVRSGNILPLKIFTCSDIIPHDRNKSDINEMPVACEGEVGKAISVKFRLYEFDPTGNPWNNRGPSFQSGCLGNITNSDGSKIFSAVNLPLFEDSQKFPFEIISYDGDNCGGDQSIFRFREGNGNPADGHRGFFFADGSHVNVLLQSDLCANMENESALSMGTGTEADPYLVCSKNQLQNLVSDPFSFCMGKYYELGTDINVNELAPMCNYQYPFAGVFHGNGHTLSGFTHTGPGVEVGIGLFSYVGHNSVISDLTLDGFSVTSSGSSRRIGALIGSISSMASNQSIEVRNITLKNSTIDGFTSSAYSTGGIIGYLSSSISTTRIEIAHNTIEDSNAIIGLDSTGGIIGYAYSGGVDLEIRDNSVKSDISGRGYVAGIVGQAYHYSDSDAGQIMISGNKVEGPNSSPRVTITSKSGYAGGIVGKMVEGYVINSSAMVKIEIDHSSTRFNLGGIVGTSLLSTSTSSHLENRIINNFADIVINETNINNSVGGIIGYAEDAFISNNKAVVNIVSNGERYGGIVGLIVDNLASNSGTSAIEYSSAEGQIVTSTEINNNKFRGGLVGVNGTTMPNCDVYEGADISYSISNVDINGGSYDLGGIVGYNRGDIDQVVSLGAVAQDYAVTNVGGIIGLSGYCGSGVSISNIVTKSNVTFKNSSSCSTCGKFVGNDSSSGGNSYTNIVAENLIFNGLGTDMGSVNGLNFPNITGTIKTSLDDACLSGGISCGGNIWEDDNDDASLNFYNRWMALSPDDDSDDFPDVAGNSAEPLHIGDCHDWNLISNNEFLLNKSFTLKSNIQFGSDYCSGNFEPIGGPLNEDAEPFFGHLTSESKNYSIIGVNLVNSEEIDHIGIIRKLGEMNGKRGQVGNWDQPLNVLNLSINDTATNSHFIGTIGSVENGSVYLNVLDSSINTTTSGYSVGGVVGEVNYGEIAKSSFVGDVNAGGASDVGGLVGAIFKNEDQEDIHVRIERSNVILGMLDGNISVGGLVGTISSSDVSAFDSLIQQNYVWIDPAGDDTTDNMIADAEGQVPGGIIGYCSNNQMEIEMNYVDIRNAHFSTNPTGDNIFMGGTVTGIFSNNFYIDGTTTNDTDPNIRAIASHELLFDAFSDVNDWNEWEMKDNKVQFKVYEHED